MAILQEEPDALGWRDLTRTQWRLSKGDEQLDFTYSNSDKPHHISDEILSELAYCIYKVSALHDLPYGIGTLVLAIFICLSLLPAFIPACKAYIIIFTCRQGGCQ